MKMKEKYCKKLLVEGNDDRHVILALCEQFKIPETFDIIDCEGINNLYETIPVRLKQANIETVGVIIDADVDLNGRWVSINKYPLIHKSKARIHSWLSWQEDPGTPMGLSITKRYLTTDNEGCKQLINWLQKLFFE